jgi:SPP1 gp7 family putative phage head morphogenesis protein
MPDKIPEKLFNSVVKDQVQLDKYSIGLANRVESLLKKTQADVVGAIAKNDPTGPVMTKWRADRLEKLNADISSIVDSRFSEIKDSVKQDLSAVAKAQASNVVQKTNAAIGANLFEVTLDPKNVKSILENTLIDGKLIGDWWDKQSADTKSLLQGQMIAGTQALQIGMVQGESVGELINRIKGTATKPGIMNITRRAAASLVRTSVMQVANNVRMETYKANADVLAGVQVIATLDGKTTPTCRALDGKAYDMEGRPIGHEMLLPPGPPFHFNCRSSMMPLLKSFEELVGIKSPLSKQAIAEVNDLPGEQRASMNGQVAGDLDYNGWLKILPIKEQQAILGPGKWKLWFENNLDMTDLVDNRANPLTLKELQAAFGDLVAKKELVLEDQLKNLASQAEGVADFNKKVGELSQQGDSVYGSWSLAKQSSEQVIKLIQEAEAMTYEQLKLAFEKLKIKNNFFDPQIAAKLPRPHLNQLYASLKQHVGMFSKGKQWPEIIIKELSQSQANWIGSFTPANNKIAINSKYAFNVQKMATAGKNCMSSKFHCPSFANYSLKSTLDHELGHSLTTKEPKALRKLKLSLKKIDIQTGVSKYATKSRKEFFAEAWEEYLNAEHPRLLARTVGDIVTKKDPALVEKILKWASTGENVFKNLVFLNKETTAAEIIKAKGGASQFVAKVVQTTEAEIIAKQEKVLLTDLKDANKVVTFTPKQKLPEGIFTPVEGGFPALAEGKKTMYGKLNIYPDTGIIHEPIMASGKQSAGMILIDAETEKVWLCSPKGQFGGYQNTFPKGTIEQGVSRQVTAIKEVFEETGLEGKPLFHLGDYKKTTGTTRYYVGVKTGGSPAMMGWESEAVHLCPLNKLSTLLNSEIDKDIAKDFISNYKEALKLGEGKPIKGFEILNKEKIAKDKVENLIEEYSGLLGEKKIGALNKAEIKWEQKKGIIKTDIYETAQEKIGIWAQNPNTTGGMALEKYKGNFPKFLDTDNVEKVDYPSLWKKVHTDLLKIKSSKDQELLNLINTDKGAIAYDKALKAGKISKAIESDPVAKLKIINDELKTMAEIAKAVSPESTIKTLGATNYDISDPTQAKKFKKMVNFHTYKFIKTVQTGGAIPNAQQQAYNFLSDAEKRKVQKKLAKFGKTVPAGVVTSPKVTVKIAETKVPVPPAETVKPPIKSKVSVEPEPAGSSIKILGATKYDLSNEEEYAKFKKMVSFHASKYVKWAAEGKAIPNAQQQAYDFLDEFQKAKVNEKIGLLKAKLGLGETMKPVPSSVAKKLDFDNLVKYGSAEGSNVGGYYNDINNPAERYYIKFSSNPEIARNEVLTNKLYQAAGVDVPDVQLIDVNGKTGVASKIVDGLLKDGGKTLKQGVVTAGVNDGFVVDAWLANWDVVGLNYDNMLIKDGVKAIRMDNGGGLRFRAQGTPKGTDFGKTVFELETMRGVKNPQAAKIFGKITKADLQAGARKVISIPDSKIEELVRKFGPASEVEKTKLLETLIARKKYIKAEFPEIKMEAPAKLPAGATDRITKFEANAIEKSRINGYAVKTDKKMVEDQQVLFWTEKNVQGKPLVCAQFKLRAEGAEKMNSYLSGTQQGAYDSTKLYDSIMTTLRGIAMVSREGNALRGKDITRAKESLALFKSEIQSLKASNKYRLSDVQNLENHFKPWLDVLETTISRGEGTVYKWAKDNSFKNAFTSPDSIVEKALDSAKSSVQFVKTPKSKIVVAKNVVKGYARQTEEVLDMASHYSGQPYETVIDGVKIKYWPDNNDTPFSFRGLVRAETQGQTKAEMEKILSVLEEKLSLDMARASQADQELLYLSQIAYSRNSPACKTLLTQLEKGPRAGDIEKQIDFLKKGISSDAGFDITKSSNYNYEGFTKTYGTGKLHNYRPDYVDSEWKEFENGHKIVKDVGGSGRELLRQLLDNGGEMISNVERGRKGFDYGGMSPVADIDTGGANYFFTRIKTNDEAFKFDIVWNARVLRRVDAISYPRDLYGKTTGKTVTAHRQNHNVASLKNAANGSSNETNFKQSLSVLDPDLETWICSSPSQKQEMIEIMREHGYREWPGGKKLSDVFLTKEEAIERYRK